MCRAEPTQLAFLTDEERTSMDLNIQISNPVLTGQFDFFDAPPQGEEADNQPLIETTDNPEQDDENEPF